MLQEQELAVGDARQPSAEPPGTPSLVFGLDGRLVAFPILAVRRIGNLVVERAPEAILRKRCPEPDVPGVPLEETAVRMLEYVREITPVLLPLIAHPGFDYEDFTRRNPEAPLNRLVEALLGWLGEREGAGASEKRSADIAAMTLVTSLMSLAMLERMGVHGGETDEATVRDVARLVGRGRRAPG